MAKFLEQFVDHGLPAQDWDPSSITQEQHDRLYVDLLMLEHAKRLALRLPDADKPTRAIDHKCAATLAATLRQFFTMWGGDWQEFTEFYAKAANDDVEPNEKELIEDAFAEANTAVWLDWVPRHVQAVSAEMAQIATNAIATDDRDVIKAANRYVNRLNNERNAVHALLLQYTERIEQHRNQNGAKPARRHK